MSKSKVNMPKELEKKCHMAIHLATVAAAAAGAIPIPMSDAIPITATQIGMIIKLAKVFGVTLTDATAKSIVGVGMTNTVGRSVATSLIKAVPGAGTIIGGAISAATAAALTEALGWMVADDFYRMYMGEDPENIVEKARDIKEVFEGKGMRVKYKSKI